MKKDDFLKEQASFAYRTAAKTLITLFSICIVFLLAFLKANPTRPFQLPPVGREIDDRVLSLESRLIKELPRIQVHDDTLKRILEWGIESTDAVNKAHCSPSGVFAHMFYPWEPDTFALSFKDLFQRYRECIDIHRLIASVPLQTVRIGNLYGLRFVSFADSTDLLLVQANYPSAASLSITDSARTLIVSEFSKIMFRQSSYSIDPVEDSLLRNQICSLQNVWEEYKDSLHDSKEFTFENLRKLSRILQEYAPLGMELNLPAAGSVDGSRGFLLLGPLLFILFSFTLWFFRKARNFESAYWKSASTEETRFPLSSINSGLLFFLEHSRPKRIVANTPDIRTVSNFFAYLLALLVTCGNFVLVVGIPCFLSFLLPLYMRNLIPPSFPRVLFLGFAYGNVILSLTIWLSIELPKYGFNWRRVLVRVRRFLTELRISMNLPTR